MTPALWPHQERAVAEVSAAVSRGVRRIGLTSPTGGGKSRIVRDLLVWARGMDWRAGVLTNRKVMIDQLVESLGLECGVRAAGYPDERQLPIQISSIQTEHRRAFKREEHLRWQLHKARLLFVDEGHLHTNKQSQTVIQAQIEAGCQVVYVTATPVSMRSVLDVLIQAGVNSELRQCGALVRAVHFGPSEPDFKTIKRLGQQKYGPSPNDITENEAKKLVPPKHVWGSVWEWFQKLNPDRRPTILFAPGVAESLWFAERFAEKGVRSAHVDGDCVWIADREQLGRIATTHGGGGTFYDSSPEARERVRQESRTGEIEVVTNRFVFREGVDWPWLSHGIFATVMSTIVTFLQSGGRLLRACDGKERCTIQDHGGHWWRFGSLNVDRVWDIEDTEHSVVGTRMERLHEKKEPEPRLCPKCGAVMNGRFCAPEFGGCGLELSKYPRSRRVITSAGTMREMVGDVFKPKNVQQAWNTAYLWKTMYYRARASKKGMTFAQAAGLFARENLYHPPRTLPLMPKREIDWWKLVRDVPPEDLL